MEFLGGDIDILVNNAGTQIRHKCEEFPLEDWEKVLRVNLTSAFVMSQLAGRIMLKKGYGKIINIASVVSFSGGYTVPAYAASKGGLAQMTKTFCNEWAVRGVNINAIAPGYIDTDNLIGLNETRLRQIMDRIPAGRLGKPEDLVGMVIYLASKASDYVHGTVQLVDGGWQAR
jgi:2-deoxy-D-gluconate 3-dehydrogenase